MIFDTKSLNFIREKIIGDTGYATEFRLTYNKIKKDDQLHITAIFYIGKDCFYVQNTSALSVIESIKEEAVHAFLLISAEAIISEFKSVYEDCVNV